MKIVYTYCNIKGEELSPFFVKMANLSVFSMKKFTKYKCELYTDCPQYFNNMCFDDIHLINFFDWNWDKRYWNIPKFKTYTLQKEPFLHVDLDMIIMPNFKLNENVDIISENIRTLLDNEKPYRHLSKDLSDGNVLCSGIIGGSTSKTYDLFEELYDKAKNECYDGRNDDVCFDDLFSIEENWLNYRTKQLAFSRYIVPQYMFYHCSGNDKELKYNNIINNFIFGFKNK